VNHSIILATTTRFLISVLLMFSFYLLLRGHNLPGGGFVGGLVGGASFALYGIAFGVATAQKALIMQPRLLIGWGLVAAILSGLPGLFFGEAFLFGFWDDTPIPLIGKFGTPLLFDVGVYMVVAGIILHIIFTLTNEEIEDPREEEA